MPDIESRLARLEQELEKLQDCEAIRQLLASYGPLADSADNEEGRQRMGDLFTDEGSYDLADDWSATGPVAIGELLNNPTHLDLVANGSAHVMGMPYIELDGERATALSYSRVYRHENGEFIVWRVSANLWQCQRVKGAWKVTRRTNRLLNGSDDARELLRHIGLTKP